jgi:exonuclease III
MKLLTWNIDRKSTRTEAGQKIKKIITEGDFDIVCLTEATSSIVPDYGYFID